MTIGTIDKPSRALSLQNAMPSACHTHSSILLASTILDYWPGYFQATVITTFKVQWL